MPLALHYTDSRLAALYDTVCPYGPDTAFYLDLAAELAAASIVDVGCGTGQLAVEYARRGHQVSGVDPATAMLDVARKRPDGGHVRWFEGDGSRVADLAGEQAYDLAVMTGHAAQVFLDDEDWRTALASIHAALRPGARLAFESRNPEAREWAGWTPEASRRTLHDPAAGPLDVWAELLEVRDGRVRFGEHYLLASTGEHLVSANEIAFRTREELARSLADNGFTVEHLYGDWDRRPVDAASPELIFVARRA